VVADLDSCCTYSLLKASRPGIVEPKKQQFLSKFALLFPLGYGAFFQVLTILGISKSSKII